MNKTMNKKEIIEYLKRKLIQADAAYNNGKTKEDKKMAMTRVCELDIILAMIERKSISQIRKEVLQ